jgi:PIN domain nuclease of toxin-antitoxin system
LIEDPNATIWVSAASLWEISIKHDLGRGEMPVSGPDALAFFQEAGLRILSIAAEHVVAVAALPPHHQDPFDRILVAQAQVEPMHLITHDALVAKYDPAIILV